MPALNSTVTGTGIPGGTVVTAVSAGAGFTLSNNATVTNATASLSVQNNAYLNNCSRSGAGSLWAENIVAAWAAPIPGTTIPILMHLDW